MTGSLFTGGNGSDNSGAAVEDGVYSLRVSASDPLVSGFNQTEIVSIYKDTTLPSIVLNNFENGYLNDVVL